MPNLRAKGSSDFVETPSRMAQNETQIVLASFRNAAEGLLELTNTPSKAASVEENSLRTFMLLKRLYEDVIEDMERIGLMLDVVEMKLTDFGGVDDAQLDE